MTASLEALPLARRITEQAYRAGASLVTTLYVDDEAALMRYHFAPDESFDKAANWLVRGNGRGLQERRGAPGHCRRQPALLSNEDPEKVGRANRAVSQAYRPALELITRHADQLDHRGLATPAWAAAMFPDLSERTWRWLSCGRPSSRPRASTATIQLPRGSAMTPRCRAAPLS
jgi:aminopeptidase